MREQVRYKLYVNTNPKWRELLVMGRMHNYATYSKPCYVDTLNKENQRRLRILMDEATPIDTYIPDVGYKVKYRYSNGTDDLFVYVIDGVVKRLADRDDSGRERIPLHRVRWSRIPEWRKHSFGSSPVDPSLDHGKAFLFYTSGFYNLDPVYVDRFTKKEMEKLAMLLILPEGVYLENVGCVQVNRKGERLFFMEVEDE